ncbi:Calx-beta domain-containing protein [Microvirga lotononidis]|uniref:Putative calcium-binding protein n=1 Tax=Microvirga lotononidis TaxID=864069 RepID=I4YP94_9HYPH|nr:putative calcium-binding protein [Microvirga lotononidis]EIM25786.1 putative calcium-binding protein [Microvirga lotononidis]WQO25709.1 hypothetical protein U0023_13395 [Microvirga lotononidis]
MAILNWNAGPGGTNNSPTNNKIVIFPENQQTDVLIGTVTTYDSTLTYRWKKVGGVDQNQGGRYRFAIENGQIKIYVASGGPAMFDYDGQFPFHSIQIEGVNGSGAVIDLGQFTINLTDVAEPSTDILTVVPSDGYDQPASMTIQEGQAGALAGMFGVDQDEGGNQGYSNTFQLDNTVANNANELFSIAQNADGVYVLSASNQLDWDSYGQPGSKLRSDDGGTTRYYIVGVKTTDAGNQTFTKAMKVFVTNNPVDDVALPTITATAATVNAESTGTVYATPFNGNLSVSYGNTTDQLTVEVSFPAGNGAFQGQTAGGDATTKIYSFTGTLTQVNTWLAGLQFNPADSYTGAGQTTTFTVQVKPQGAGTWSATSNAIAVAADINDNAVISTGQGDQAATVGSAINPFKDMVLTDEENDDITLTVTFAAGGGTWGGLTSGGGVTVVNNAGTGTLTFTGKAGAVTTFLDAVTFTPTAAGTKTFAYSVVDQHTGAGQHTAVTGTNFTVTATALPSLAIEDQLVHEGNNGVTLITFTVTRSGDPSVAVDVDWALSHVTTNGTDFVFDPGHPANGSLHFAAGQVTQQVVIQVAGDTDFEQNETFRISLSNPTTGVTITRATATGTIMNDDTDSGNSLPTIAVGGNGQVEFTATNQGPVDAFDNLIVADAESDTLSLAIEFNAADGNLIAADGASVFIPNPGQGTVKRYDFGNNLTAQQVNDILHALRFDPADRAAGGAPVTTTFTIKVTDVAHPTTPVTNTDVKVTSTPPANQPNHAPAGLSLSNNFVLEYAAPGSTEIGVLSATDPDGQTLTFSLLENAGGRFAISGNKLVLAGPGVNYEEAKSHQIKVRVDDGHGGVQDQVFTINVGDQVTLNKRGTKKPDKLNGSALDDILKGGTGTAKDIIKGLAGDDQLYGENGDDSLVGGDGLDSLYGGNGNDTLKGDAGKDFLKGDAGNDKMYGGLGNDVLYGGKGNDLLKGDADDDVLYGEEGNDKLYGGAGNDTFVFNKKTNKATNFDQIYDFKSAQDKIFLDNAVFKKLGTAGTFDAPVKLDASMFRTNKAKDKNDYLVYKGGVLYYDADGSGKGTAVEIVKVKGLKVTDIWVI